MKITRKDIANYKLLKVLLERTRRNLKGMWRISHLHILERYMVLIQDFHINREDSQLPDAQILK